MVTRNSLKGEAVILSVLVLGAGCAPSREAGASVTVTREWTQIGGASTHSQGGAEGPSTPLEHVWTFEGDHLPLEASELFPPPDPSQVPGLFWRAEFGSPTAVTSSILVVSDKVYAIDLAGQLRWRYSVEAQGVHLVGPVLVPPLAIVGFVDPEENVVGVVALDLESGDEQWDWSAPTSSSGVWFAADDDRVLLVANEQNHASVRLFDANGSVIWETRSQGASVNWPALNSRLAILATDRGIEAFRLDDGTRLWSQKLGAAVAPPAIAGGAVLVAVGNDGTADGLISYSTETGRPLAETEIPAGIANLAVGGEAVYVEEYDVPVHQLTAYDMDQLRMLWRTAIGSGVDSLDALLPLDGNVLAAANSGGRYQLALLSPQGVTWKQNIPRPPYPASEYDGFSEGPAYLASTGGGLLLTMKSGLVHAYVPSGRS